MASASENDQSTGTLVVLNFTILEDADQGDYSVMVSEYGEGNIYDIDYNDVKFDFVSGTVTVEVAEHEHVFDGKTNVIKEADCTNEGLRRTYCSVNGCKEYVETVINATGHTPGEWITEKEATCTENGLKVKYCTVCNEEYAKEVTDVLGHNYRAWKVTKEASIGVDGEEERVCSRCNEKETRVIPAIIHGEDDHTFNGKTEVIEEADCTSDGVKRIYCSFKGCNAYKEIAIPATGHSFEAWTVVKEPTCTEKGRKETVCSLCHDKKTDDIPAIGHAYSDWQTVKEPTFHEDGLQKRVCENCGDELEAVLPKLSEGHEHDFSGDQILIKEATCTEPGLVNVRCSNPECEAVKEIQTAKKGHSFGEWTVVKNAEVGVKGIKERQCTVCGDKENMEIPEVPQTEPVILKGQNGTWTQESEAGLSFRSDALFVHFVSVSVDGNVIDAENYTAKEGSTIIELKPEYLATLSTGEHSISINSLNGSATTKFEIKVKSVVDSDTPKLENADKNSETEKAASVKTGDETHMSLWLLLLIVSGASIVMVLPFPKKKRRIG